LGGILILNNYASYAERLDALVEGYLTEAPSSEVSSAVEAALDGQAGQELRRLVSLNVLRADGIFFTGSRLARRALEPILPTLDKQSVILDPACGAGDLLLCAAEALALAPDLETTVRSWGEQLHGWDLHHELVVAAKRRLLLAALSRFAGGARAIAAPHATFSRVQAKCALESAAGIGRATHILVNPPYAGVEAPTGCTWGSGKVSQAAVFLDTILENARQGSRIVAILPDVLRSGSRYKRWRQAVETKARIERIEPVGLFSSWADVDVFILELSVTKPATEAAVSWRQCAASNSARVADYFTLRIGPVVDYRAPHKGPVYPFIHPRTLPPWGTVAHIEDRRKFEGAVLEPPFVAVRRTSRPGDRHRAVGTFITGSNRVAVENHLICLHPKDGSYKACRDLLAVLKDKRSTDWLDQRIRCRHLTVGALGELPWWT